MLKHVFSHCHELSRIVTLSCFHVFMLSRFHVFMLSCFHVFMLSVEKWLWGSLKTYT